MRRPWMVSAAVAVGAIVALAALTPILAQQAGNIGLGQAAEDSATAEYSGNFMKRERTDVSNWVGRERPAPHLNVRDGSIG